MRRITVPLAFALIVLPVAATLVIYAMENADDASPAAIHTPSSGSRSVRGEGVLRDCAEGNVDPAFPGEEEVFTLQEADQLVESLLVRAAPVAAPPSDTWKIAAARTYLFERREDESGDISSRQLDDEGGAIIYTAPDRRLVVTVEYQPFPQCESFGRESRIAVSTESSSVDVRYSTFSGARSSSSGNNVEQEQFEFEAIRGGFELPDSELTVVITIEWEVEQAPGERLRFEELEHWTRAILEADD